MAIERLQDKVARWMGTRARVEAFYGGTPDELRAAGEVVGYYDHPTILIRADSGEQLTWSCRLVREAPAPGDPEVHDEWATARAELDGPFAAVWRAVAESMEAGEVSQSVASRALDAVWESAETVTGADLIRRERMGQVDREGYTPAHDAQHEHGELLTAALVYLGSEPGVAWPWGDTSPSRGSVTDRLVKAGALIAAEIDRLRAADQPQRPAVGDYLTTSAQLSAAARIPDVVITGEELGRGALFVSHSGTWFAPGSSVPAGLVCATGWTVRHVPDHSSADETVGS